MSKALDLSVASRSFSAMSRGVHSRYPISVNPGGYQWLNADVSTYVLRNGRKKRGAITPRKLNGPSGYEGEKDNVKKPSFQLIWLFTCLIGFAVHSYFVTDTFLEYEVATETVIETPKYVKPPATSVCFLLWHLLKNESFPLDHPCRRSLRKKAAIEKCVEELTKNPLKEILSMTHSPLKYLEFFELREVSNAWSIYKTSDQATMTDASNKQRIQEYYNGPYRCIRFETRDSDSVKKLSVSNLTKGYPKARYFLNASFDVSPNITPHIVTVRVYVHEPYTFPRGAITLPAILNVTRQQLFIVSYRRVETVFLPKPFKFNCVDYSGIRKLESREHCVDECMTKQDQTLPFTAVIERLDRDCNLTTKSDSKEEDSCHDNCPVDCITRTYYTMLADSSDEEETLTVITRFQEPETLVRYTPKLDLQAFIIYEAGILSMWFSACIYFTLKDFYLAVLSVAKVLFKH